MYTLLYINTIIIALQYLFYCYPNDWFQMYWHPNKCSITGKVSSFSDFLRLNVPNWDNVIFCTEGQQASVFMMRAQGFSHSYDRSQKNLKHLYALSLNNNND